MRQLRQSGYQVQLVYYIQTLENVLLLTQHYKMTVIIILECFTADVF